jgi:flagellar motor protein MotB
MAPRDDSDDRQAILARRAIFVTTALAALGCSSQGGQGTPTSTVATSTSTVIATAQTTATSTSSGSASVATSSPSSTPDAAGRLASWEKARAAAPPLDVAASLPAREKPELEQVKSEMTRIYDALGKVWQAAPVHCSPKDPKCSAAWQQAATALGDLKDDMRGPLCGWRLGLGAVERTIAHHGYAGTLISALEAELAAAAEKHGAKADWETMRSGAVKPTPCLKCAPPELGAVTEHRYGGAPLMVPFADGKVTPDGADAALDALVKRMGETKEAVFEVRGHADPAESGDKKSLAKKRAEAVRDALVKKGADKSRLLVVVYADDLPIGSLASDEGRAKNRRVDFEAIAKK